MLKFLGRGAGFSPENTSAYEEFDNSLLLVDCGYTVFNHVINKIDLKKYDNIYIAITHLHPDHSGSLGQLIFYLGYVVAKKATIVTACKNIQTFLDIIGVNREFYQIEDGHSIGIKFIETQHTGLLDAYGFVWNYHGKSIVYTGDTSTLEPFKDVIEKADELYVEASMYGGVHLKIEEVLNKLLEIKQNGTMVYMMHLDDEVYIANATKGKIAFANLV